MFSFPLLILWMKSRIVDSIPEFRSKIFRSPNIGTPRQTARRPPTNLTITARLINHRKQTIFLQIHQRSGTRFSLISSSNKYFRPEVIRRQSCLCMCVARLAKLAHGCSVCSYFLSTMKWKSDYITSSAVRLHHIWNSMCQCVKTKPVTAFSTAKWPLQLGAPSLIEIARSLRRARWKTHTFSY